MEARLAVFPLLFFACGVFCAIVVGMTALFRKSPAAGGVLLGVLFALVPMALLFFGYATVRTVTYTPPQPVVVQRAEVDYAPEAPVAPAPPTFVQPEIPPPPGGMTRILSPAEIPVADGSTLSPAGFNWAATEVAKTLPPAALPPVEAPRPEAEESVAAAPASPPDWVRNGSSVREGDRTLVVVTGQQFADAAAAWRDAASRAADLLRRDFEKVFRPSGQWQFDPQRVSAIRNSFTEEIRRTAGENEFTVYRTYLQVELSPTVRHQIEPVWREQVSKQRSLVVGGLFAALTAVVAALAGYFRLDDRTGGRYRRRLKFGTAVALATGVATAVAVGTGMTADAVRRPPSAPPMPVDLHAAPSGAPMSQPGTNAGHRDWKRFREVADRMVESINAADYGGVRQDFNTSMLDAFPVERCGAFFDHEISGRFGRIDALGPPEFKSPAIAAFAARCERGTLDFTLSLDENGQVAGMLFRPRPVGVPGTGVVECASQ